MRDDRHDLDRLFRCLVETLAQTDPTQLRSAFQVAEVYQTFVPYRTHRNQLGFDNNQDYEMAVLRLLAGERGYATVDPPEAGEALAAEAADVNPDPGIVREFAGATVRLAGPAVEAILQADQSYAPPDPPDEGRELESPPVETPPTPAVTEPTGAAPVFALDEQPEAQRPSESAAAICRSCGRGLPLHRTITFCPFCGKPAHARTCAGCGAELEGTWRFCVDCGTTAGTPPGSDS